MRTVSRIAWIVCLLLLTVRLGNTLLDLEAYGWTMPWWYDAPAPSADLQGKILRFQRFTYLLDLAGMFATYGLFAALFRAFEKGRIFSAEAVRIIRYLGCWSVAYYLLCLLAPALFGLPLPASQPKYFLAQIQSVLVGVSIVVASWILEEGKRVQDDQALTI